MNTPPDQNNPAARITVTDIDIPFGRLVTIILKTMLASIPAVLLMYAVLGAIMLVFISVFGVGATLLNKMSPSKPQIDFLPGGGTR